MVLRVYLKTNYLIKIEIFFTESTTNKIKN